MASSSLLLFRMASSAAKRNRLISESSPYLLQHATNPVDWYPWGEDAFKRAVSENKPIFLSVGYSTCHWCHVMERESFNNQSIADILNKHFISVKVDREERPDVDRVYMTFIQATQGGGGWPMSVFLTPDLKPFVGGTYFPPNDSQGRPGFITLLNMIKEQWASDSGTIRLRMEKVMQILQDAVTIKPKELRLPGTACIQSTAELFDKRFDKEHGGFGGQPKFPQPIILDFLLRLHNKYRDSQMGESGLDIVMGTLQAMADGGIHDHIGQGFHRYSTDKEWHVPHFEKMLYDQSQLAGIYTEAYQATGDKMMEDTARDILLYVTRDLCDEDGGFYSAEDADSYPAGKSPGDKKEGAFCVWTWDEVMELLKDPVNDVGGAKPVTMGDIVTEYYGMKPKGNVDRIKDPHGELIGQNVLIIRSSVKELAVKHSVSEDQVTQTVAKAKEILSAHRQGRPKPHRDDKIVASWNGLMISALAKASRVFGDEKYLLAACKCASFVQEHMYRQEDGVLFRSAYRDNEGNLVTGNIEGFADDYSCMICGLIDLYESSHAPKWLEWAVKLQEKQDELFWDKKGGGYFNSSGTDKTVLLQMKEDQDGSEPSPNSLSAMNLLRLSTIFHNPDYHSKAETIFKTFNEHLTDHPAALTGMVSAFIYYSSKPKQILFIGDPLDEGSKGLMNVVNSFHIPNKVMVFHDPANPSSFLTGRIPILTGMRLMDGKPTVQVCEDYQCQAPTNDPAVLRNMLKPQKII